MLVCMSFTSSHSSLVIVLSEHEKLVPVDVCVWKHWVKITCSFSAWLACIPTVFFYTPCFPSAPVYMWHSWCWDIGLWRSLLGSLGATPLWKGITQKCRMSPQASLRPFLPLLLVINTSLLVFSGSDCSDVFLALSLIGKSHWRCKTAHELWLQKREKCSSERLRSGQSTCTLTGGNKRMC